MVSKSFRLTLALLLVASIVASDQPKEIKLRLSVYVDDYLWKQFLTNHKEDKLAEEKVTEQVHKMVSLVQKYADNLHPTPKFDLVSIKIWKEQHEGVYKVWKDQPKMVLAGFRNVLRANISNEPVAELHHMLAGVGIYPGRAGLAWGGGACSPNFAFSTSRASALESKRLKMLNYAAGTFSHEIGHQIGIGHKFQGKSCYKPVKNWQEEHCSTAFQKFLTTGRGKKCLAVQLL